MNGFLAWLQNIGHTLKGWVDFMTPDEWIVLGMVIAALALAMTGTSMTRSVKRKRRVRRADATANSVAETETEERSEQQPEEVVFDDQKETAEKDEIATQEVSQEMPGVAAEQPEETAVVEEDDNLSVEVNASHSSEMAPLVAEDVNASPVEEPLSPPAHVSDAPSETPVELTDEELLVDRPEEAQTAREENHPVQENEESPAEEIVMPAEPEQSAGEIAAVPSGADSKNRSKSPFKPKREIPSVSVSYEVKNQSRSRGARREDIASLTGGGDPVAAKLNLARVYSDTGDSKEAQQLLQEVVEEGTEAQQRAAKSYLEKLQQREDI